VISRRIVTSSIAGTAFASMVFPCARSNAAELKHSPAVKTSNGVIRGLVRPNGFTFMGISYGAPTDGAARFMPPRKPAPWSGVRDAATFGQASPQVPMGLSPFTSKDGPPRAPPPPSPAQQQLGAMFSGRDWEFQQGEDCLFLNVWTPALDKAKRPVMVWLHGGGFGVGAGSGAVSNGARLSDRGDVVVVTINHRLNVFGFLYLGEVAGDAFAQSGNVGMLDIVAALQWVRENISVFGGDPGNVTIFGESGGAGKVSVVCAMPAAKGLFHKAIMQSGPCLQVTDKALGTAIAKQVLSDLGLSAARVPELQRLDARKVALAAAAAELRVAPRVLGIGPRGLTPVVDGVVLPHHPFDGIAAPESAHVPFLVGSCKDEAVLFTVPLPGWGEFTEQQVTEMIRPIAGARAEEVVAFYKQHHSADSPSYLLADIVTDYWMRHDGNTVAQLKVQQGAAPVYVYMLEWEVTPLLRCPHATDVTLVFNNLEASPIMTSAPGAQLVADQMSDAWIAFARTGNPASRSNPQWPAYTLPRRANMVFNTKSRIVGDYDKASREFWEKA
jgi:para-nitrobenzyl esterase